MGRGAHPGVVNPAAGSSLTPAGWLTPACPQCHPPSLPCLCSPSPRPLPLPPFAALQVHGTLIELFDCRKELYTATEVVANNSLFHVVVSQHMHACMRRHSRHSRRGGCAPLLASPAQLGALRRRALLPASAHSGRPLCLHTAHDHLFVYTHNLITHNQKQKSLALSAGGGRRGGAAPDR